MGRKEREHAVGTAHQVATRKWVCYVNYSGFGDGVIPGFGLDGFFGAVGYYNATTGGSGVAQEVFYKIAG